MNMSASSDCIDPIAGKQVEGEGILKGKGRACDHPSVCGWYEVP